MGSLGTREEEEEAFEPTDSLEEISEELFPSEVRIDEFEEDSSLDEGVPLDDELEDEKAQDESRSPSSDDIAIILIFIFTANMIAKIHVNW